MKTRAPITRGAGILLAVEVGLSMIYLLSAPEGRVRFASYLVASGDALWRDLHLWTLVTSPVVELELVALLFHGLLLWMFVPALEGWWGTRRLLAFAAWTSLAGILAGTLVGLATGQGAVPVSGLDPFLYACFVAYGLLFSGRQVQFFGVLPMTGRQLMYGISAFVAVFVVLGQEWASGASFAAAMGLAYLMISGKWTPRLAYLRWKEKRLRRHLRVVPGGKTDRWVN